MNLLYKILAGLILSLILCFASYRFGFKNGSLDVQTKFDQYKIDTEQQQKEALKKAVDDAKSQAQKDFDQLLKDEQLKHQQELDKEKNKKETEKVIIKWKPYKDPNCLIDDETFKRLNERLKNG